MRSIETLAHRASPFQSLPLILIKNMSLSCSVSGRADIIDLYQQLNIIPWFEGKAQKNINAIRSIIDADMARQQRVHGIFKDFYVIQNRFSCSAHQ